MRVCCLLDTSDSLFAGNIWFCNFTFIYTLQNSLTFVRRYHAYYHNILENGHGKIQ